MDDGWTRDGWTDGQMDWHGLYARYVLDVRNLKENQLWSLPPKQTLTLSGQLWWGAGHSTSTFPLAKHESRGVSVLPGRRVKGSNPP